MDRSATGIARCIRLAREGQEGALEALLSAYRNYMKVLAATCLDRDVRGKADPSDVVQEAMIKAHRGFAEFRGATEGEWMAWVRRILVNCIAELHRRFSNAGRRIGKERPLEDLMDQSSLMMRGLVPAPGPSPSEHAARRELSVAVADVLAEMEPEDREVVILRNFQELEWNEVAERMQRSRDAVRQLWTRALRRIGPLLKERLA
jgi:RNA polymerase sigma-70 factor (ECF subfamily)